MPHSSAILPVSEQELRVQILDSLNKVWQLWRNEKAPEALAIAREALAMAENALDAGLEARALIAITDIYRFTNQQELIPTYFQRINKLHSSTSNRKDLAYISRALGVHYREQGNLSLSLEYLFKAKALYEQLNEPHDLAFTLNSLAVTLNHSGNFHDALRYYLAIIQMQQSINDKSMLARPLINLGSLYMKLNDYHKALHYLEEALVITKTYALHEGTALTHGNMGECFLFLDQLPIGKKHIDTSLMLWQRLGGTLYLPKLFVSLGQFYLRFHKYSKAMTVFRKAEYMATSHNNIPVLIQAMDNIANLQHKSGNSNAALDTLLSALAIVEHTDYTNEKLIVHELLASCYSNLGTYQSAYEHTRRAIQLRKEFASLEHLRAMATTEVQEKLYTLEKRYNEFQQRARQAELIAEQKEKELQEASVNLTQSMKVLERVRNTVTPYLYKAKGQTKELATVIFKEISQIIGKHHTQHSSKHFDVTYHEFIQKLHRSYPDLTPTEIKVSILIRMDYSTKQIAHFLYSSELTIKKHRVHIRKKLHLDEQENLQNYLLAI